MIFLFQDVCLFVLALFACVHLSGRREKLRKVNGRIYMFDFSFFLEFLVWGEDGGDFLCSRVFVCLFCPSLPVFDNLGEVKRKKKG